MLDGEIAKQRPRGHGDVAHAALHEISRGHRLGKDHQVNRRVELGDLRQHAADLLEIGGILALAGADLGDGETRHAGKIVYYVRVILYIAVGCLAAVITGTALASKLL